MDLRQGIRWLEEMEADLRRYADSLEDISLEKYAKGIRDKAKNINQLIEWLKELEQRRERDGD